MNTALLSAILVFNPVVPKGALTEKPIRTILLTQIQQAQANTTVGIPGKKARLSVSFGEDYAPYLGVTVGEKRTDFLWNRIRTPVEFEGHTIQHDGPFAKVCSNNTCASVSFDGLTELAYANGLRLEVPHVKYTLLISPDGKWLGMLRKDQSGMFYVGEYTFEEMQKETIWFVAVNSIMYGLKYQDHLLTLVSKPTSSR